jgi:hypothetical protein
LEIKELNLKQLYQLAIDNIEITIVIACLIVIFILLVLAIFSGGKKTSQQDLPYPDDIDLSQLVKELQKASVNSRWLLEQYELKVRQKEDEMQEKNRYLLELNQVVSQLKAAIKDSGELPVAIKKVNKIAEKILKNKEKSYTNRRSVYFYFYLGTFIGALAVILAIATYFYIH